VGSAEGSPKLFEPYGKEQIACLFSPLRPTGFGSICGIFGLFQTSNFEGRHFSAMSLAL